jgi:HK97 family phage prohead protease
VIRTGARVRRRDEWSGESWDEVLSMAPGAIRLGRLNAGAQLLDGHNYLEGYARVLGSVVPGTALVDQGKRLVAQLKISRNEAGEALSRNLVDGHSVLLSAGYKTHKEEINTRTLPVTRTAIDWEPHEVSVVTVPAEAEARIRSDASRRKTPRAERDYEPGTDRYRH